MRASQISSASRGAARTSASSGTATRPEPAGAAPDSAWAATGSPAKVSPGPPQRVVGRDEGDEGPLSTKVWGGQRHLCQTTGNTWARGQAGPVANTPFLPGLSCGLPAGLRGPCRPAGCRGSLPPPGPSVVAVILPKPWCHIHRAAHPQRRPGPAGGDGSPRLSAEPEHELFLVYGKGRPGIIRGMDMGAKVPDEHMIPIENLMNPRALDFHAETGFIYFADTTSYLIGRQKIDGTERETILKDGAWLRGTARSLPSAVGPWELAATAISAFPHVMAPLLSSPLRL